MRIATMSGTKIRRPRSPRLRLMRIVLIKVALELVNFGRIHGWFRKPPMALIRSSMSMIISFSITKWLGRRENAVTTALVTLDPLLPASGCDPQTVDQHDGVRGGRGGSVLGSHNVLLESTLITFPRYGVT
jgi:hypothetical protein